MFFIEYLNGDGSSWTLGLPGTYASQQFSLTSNPHLGCDWPGWTYEGVRFYLAERGGPKRSMLGGVVIEEIGVNGSPSIRSFLAT